MRFAELRLKESRRETLNRLMSDLNLQYEKYQLRMSFPVKILRSASSHGSTDCRIASILRRSNAGHLILLHTIGVQAMTKDINMQKELSPFQERTYD